ncbi:hypothetical protein TVAG_463960 [Trichomonas vaginalis G3]|uniref:Uncharacterized protein n=1 Tax=Trichomonas vaginalis (strain ATCC PRA-98 / G3) TaxID=412133 RepID=A2E248_TRIV3|nr:hypothetical protein TVAGG3_1048860 [Trichomonas vaginalis G3]EAY13262.1 hypothetical protein TVAG_463960 [Trichomonas vaginalis G3]KAI5494079.1 hypothetical protein TVAGG3_1048860 [Trichomonas vaginalis G3]|eukprot:XP_001325485.1 hypothetical protein [Trichomonas vaginalis G3]
MDLFDDLISSISAKDKEIQELSDKISTLKSTLENNIGILNVRNDQINNFKSELDQFKENSKLKIVEKQEISKHLDDITNQCNDQEKIILESQKEINKLQYHKQSLEEHLNQIQETCRSFQNDQLQKQLSENQTKKQCLKLNLKSIQGKIDELNRNLQLIRENAEGNIQTTTNEHKIWKETRAFKIQTLKAENESLSQVQLQNEYRFEKLSARYKSQLNEIKKSKSKDEVKVQCEYTQALNELRQIFEQKYFYSKKLEEQNNENINKAKQETELMHHLRQEMEKMGKDVKKIQEIYDNKSSNHEYEYSSRLENLHKLYTEGKLYKSKIIQNLENDPHLHALLDEFREKLDIFKTECEHKVMFSADKTKVLLNKFNQAETLLKTIWNSDTESKKKCDSVRKAFDAAKLEANNEKEKLIKINDDFNALRKEVIDKGIRIEQECPCEPIVTYFGINTPIIIKPGANEENVRYLKECVEKAKAKREQKIHKIDQMKKELIKEKTKNRNLKCLVIKLVKLTKKIN